MAARRTMEWTGPGATAFAFAAAATSSGKACPVRRFESVEALQASFEGSLEASLRALPEGKPSPGGAAAWQEALRDYFMAGGKGCIVLCDPRFSYPEWVGEDAGPGCRSGLHALAEMDEVGTIVVPLPPSPRADLGDATGSGDAADAAAGARRAKQVLELAARRPEVFFLLEGSGERKLFFLRRNVVVLDVPGEDRPEAGALACALAGYLEAADWRPEAPFRPLRPEPPHGFARAQCLSLHAWRRREGLRRSIDLGTRWVVFEASHPLVWRRVEREVSAFIGRLETEGFFRKTGRDAPQEALCDPASRAGTAEGGSPVDPTHVVIRVRPRREDLANVADVAYSEDALAS